MDSFKFERPDGKPYKILARGDCTSRRSVRLNTDLFPNGVDFTQNEKAPFIFFLDALNGKTSSVEALRKLSDVDAMPRTLSAFYLGQAERSILEAEGADLIMLDSWGDLNFDIWEHKLEGWKCWIHPRFLRNEESFYADFQKLGKRSLDQSVEDAVKLIHELRKKNPQAKVLLLNQQLDYYPKMESRMNYYEMGRLISEKVEGAYFGGVVPKEELNLDDIGSCGPGLTLHFKADTYREMFRKAVADGLLASKPVASSPTARKETPARTSQVPQELDDADVVDFGVSSAHCGDRCPSLDHFKAKLGSYISFDGAEVRWTPAVIATRDIEDYAAWEHAVKKRYDRVRMKKRALKAGYYTHPFHPMMHTVDRHDIHHSLEERSGGTMRPAYLKSVEEMGGAPTRRYDVSAPACLNHWSQGFGVFQHEPGYMQGNQLVNERLIGYVTMGRNGDILLYSVIFGHGDHLDMGVMYLLHFDIVKWVSENLAGQTKGLKYIMYGGVQNGGAGLWQWKRTVGFKPIRLSAKSI